jgi:hypothetical protein
MTYKLDSDISWYYGKVIDRLTGEVVAPAVNVKWKDPVEDFLGHGKNRNNSHIKKLIFSVP